MLVDDEILLPAITSSVLETRSRVFHSKKTFIDDFAPIAYFTINKSGYVTALQGSIFEKYDIKKVNLLGSSIFSEESLFLSAKKYFKKAIAGEKNSTTIQINGGCFSLWLSPVYLDNEISGVSTTCIENTESIENEMALEEIHRHYSLLAEHTTDLITKYSPDGNCTYASPAVKKVLGFRPDEMLGKSVFHFFHPDDLKSKRRYLTKLLDKPEESFCYRVQRKDKTYIWLETSSKAVCDPENNVTNSKQLAR